MKKKIKYTDEPMEFKVIQDFLPAPEQLILKEDTVKVTLNLNKASVDFFRTAAEKAGVPYQKMIRKVVDLYAAQYSSKRS